MYMRMHRRSFLIGAGLTIIGAFVAVIPPALIGQIIDHLGAQSDFDLIVIAGPVDRRGHRDPGVFIATGRYRTAVTARDIEFEMRDDLFHHLQRQDLAYFQHQRIGDLMARMTNDLNAVRMMLAMGIFNLTQTTAVVAFVVVAMLTLSVQLTVISLVILPFVSLTLAVIGRIVHSRFERLQAQFSDISTAAQENLSGIRVVKAFAQETAEIESFRGLVNQYLARAVQVAKADEFIWPAMEFILGLATLLVIVVGSAQAINLQLSLGQLVQFVAYLRLLAWPLIGLGWVSNLFQSGWASLKRLQDLWQARPSIHDEPGALDARIRGEIEFRNVTFAYGDVPVLRNVSFTVPSGTSLAIVGSIGSGKSSLVNLIPRLFDVTDGQVLIDGIDVRRHSLPILRRAIGYAPQETFLFSAPLRTNVGFGHSHELSEHELDLAGDISQLNADVPRFSRPLRHDDRRARRDAVRRAEAARGDCAGIAKNPPILILDDALSAVDTHTEAEILRRLAHVKKTRTSVVVAHRISTVKDSDQILVLAAGRIVERGTHAQLIAHRGLYLEMFRRQQLEDEFGLTPDPTIEAEIVPEIAPA